MANTINQTNATILFEEINPEKLDLLTMVGDVKAVNSISDEKVKEIVDTLCVHSFDEFIEKFDPVVYSFFNAANQKVMYTLKKPDGVPEDMLTEIHLNAQNDFLRMLLTLVDAKRSQGLLNVDFKFENLTDLISPHKIIEDIKQNRKELRYLYSQYVQLDEDDPKRLDLGDQLNVMMEEASTNYNNVMAMLPLAIEDIKTRLLLTSGGESESETPLALGVLTMGEEGELKVIEAPKKDSTMALVTIDDKVNSGLIEVIGEDYEALSEGTGNAYTKALVERTFCPLPSTITSEVDVAKEIDNYNTYLEFYKNAKDDFIKTVKPLIEKILGVRLFFEQCPSKVRTMRPSLLITNISNEMMAKAPNLPRLVAYLNTVNGKNDFTNTLWYAIFPSVAMNRAAKAKLTRQRFRGNDAPTNTSTNTIESLSTILDVLRSFRVQCFFSFEADEKNTFNAMATEGIERYIDRCMPLTGKPYSEFAIPCMPNFTVIPKDKSGVTLDTKMELNESNVAQLSREKQDIMKLWIDGVYVGAAYVACGLVAAYQSPEYLKELFRRGVDSQLPGVRFDLETGDNSLIVYTTLAKEITGFTSPVKDEINQKSFGFIFSSENAMHGGMNITNIMVYKARSLLFNDDTGVYESIYKTQVTTYIERILRHATGDYKQDRIVRFFSSNPESQASKWLDKREYCNAIIGVGDEIGYTIDEENGICTLNITFNGDVKNLEIETNRTTAAKHV